MIEPGSTLLGKYRIDQIIGKGGMGVVARAHHLQLDVPVAIKFLLRDVLDRKDMVQRFLREAQAAVKLKSEHVSRIIDVGTTEDGTPYIVMEYLHGADLGHLLRARGPLAPGLAVDLVLQACDALAEAHALGIVHRDIKPSNLFLTQGTDGAPLLKVVDFGVSKAPLTVDEDITHSSAIMGTPVYMSPEQMQSSKHVDGRTDIWALGVVLYQLISGRLPFRAESFAGLVLALATQRMRPLDDVTLAPGLADVIARCIERDVNRRYQSMTELASALTPYASPVDQAARWTARTLRALSQPLGLAGTLPEPRTGESVELQVLGTGERAALQPSTMDQSMGEQLMSGNTLPTRALRPAAATSTASAATAPAGTPAPPRRRRGLVMGAAAVGLVGATLAIGSMMRGAGDDAERVPAEPDTLSNMAGQAAALPAAAMPPATTPDAGPAADRTSPPDSAAGLATPPVDTAAIAEPGQHGGGNEGSAGEASGATSRDARARSGDPGARRARRKDDRRTPQDEQAPDKDGAKDVPRDGAKDVPKDVIDSVFGTRQ
jgi:serine/threonine protein kinase